MLNKETNRIKNIFLSGIIFLVPLVALAWVFSGALQKAINITRQVQDIPWIKSHGGLILVLPLALLLVVLIVFVLGLLVRLTILRHTKKWLEEQLLDMLPGYNFLRLTMEEKLKITEKYTPVLVQLQNTRQLGIQVDQKEEQVVVYFPNGTLVRGGTIHVVDLKQVTRLPFSLGDLEGILNSSGEGLFDKISAAQSANK